MTNLKQVLVIRNDLCMSIGKMISQACHASVEASEITRKKNIALFMLGYIGYDISLSIKNSSFFQYLIKSYQYHYFPNNISSKLDSKTYDLLSSHFINLLLTSSKK